MICFVAFGAVARDLVTGLAAGVAKVRVRVGADTDAVMRGTGGLAAVADATGRLGSEFERAGAGLQPRHLDRRRTGVSAGPLAGRRHSRASVVQTSNPGSLSSQAVACRGEAA